MELLRQMRSTRSERIIIDNVNKQLAEQVRWLKTLPNPPQRSDEWFELRKNKITASMIAPLLKIGHYGSRREVIGQKSGCLERTFMGNKFTHWGTDFEDEAVKVYEKMFNTKIHEFSLIAHPDYDFLGASPDGIADDGTMLEIKCPPSRAITGIVPDYYACQMQLQMESCNLEICDFLECLFTKYSSRKEFLSDNDFHVEMNGFTGNDEEFKRVHCEEFLDDNNYTIFKGSREKSVYEIEQDIYNGVDPDQVHKVVYWKLERISCVQVARDREWFTKALPELENAWKEIEYYRKYPEEFEKKYPGRPVAKNPAVFNMSTGRSSTKSQLVDKEAQDLANLL